MKFTVVIVITLLILLLQMVTYGWKQVMLCHLAHFGMSLKQIADIMIVSNMTTSDNPTEESRGPLNSTTFALAP